MRKDEKIKLIGQPLGWWQHQYTKVNPIQSNPIQSNLTLHLFKQAIWEHVWKHTIEEMTNMQLMWEHMWKSTFEKMTHMQLMWLCICSSRRFEKAFGNHNREILHICNFCDFASGQKAIWEHMWKHTSEKMTNMQLMWLSINTHLRKWQICN